MPRFGCPDCGFEIIEKREIVVSLHVREIVEWNEDGTPAKFADPHFEEEDIAGEATTEQLVERMYRGEAFACGGCGRGLSGPEELERLD